MHAEAGYLRPEADGGAGVGVAACIAQATGLAEASRGTWDAATRTLALRSTGVLHAAKVLEITRLYTLSEDGLALTYVVAMRTTTQPLQEHLRATLQRV